MSALGSKEKENESSAEELHEPYSFILQRLKSSEPLTIFFC